MPKKSESQEEPERKEKNTESQSSDKGVPELAENMEHTLRRLFREKERQRAKSPGLYR